MEVLFVKWKTIWKVESVLRNRALETVKKNFYGVKCAEQRHMRNGYLTVTILEQLNFKKF